MRYDRDEALETIRRTRIIAILRGVPTEKLDGVISALIAGGIRVLELTFDHASPEDRQINADKIRYAVEHYGDRVTVGCGTALSAEEAEACYGAGGILAITPNCNEKVIRKARELGMVAIPGAQTATEVVNAWEAGADIVKLFPAGELGLGYIKALRAPLSHIPMCAVGGVKPENIGTFFDAGICGVGVGGPLVVPAAVKEGNYELIRERAETFVRAIADWEAGR